MPCAIPFFEAGRHRQSGAIGNKRRQPGESHVETPLPLDRETTTLTDMKYLFITSLVTLAACASPQETCKTKATQDLRIVQSLIVEAEETLARGYRYETKTRLIPSLEICFGGERRYTNVSFCHRNVPVTNRKPVAVDLEEERRKLRSLKAKEAELQRQAARDLPQCETAGT